MKKELSEILKKDCKTTKIVIAELKSALEATKNKINIE